MLWEDGFPVSFWAEGSGSKQMRPDSRDQDGLYQAWSGPVSLD